MSFTQDQGPAKPGDQASDCLLVHAEEGRDAEDTRAFPENSSSSRPVFSLECILAEVY